MKIFLLLSAIFVIVISVDNSYAAKLIKIGSYKTSDVGFNDTNGNGTWDMDSETPNGTKRKWFWAVPSYSQTGIQIQAAQDQDGNWWTKGPGGSLIRATGP